MKAESIAEVESDSLCATLRTTISSNFRGWSHLIETIARNIACIVCLGFNKCVFRDYGRSRISELPSCYLFTAPVPGTAVSEENSISNKITPNVLSL